jgi:predicted dehydrogenase
VVEQATHFIDLVRFIAGKENDVVESSIQATSVEHDEEVGSLSKIGFDESAIEAVNRIPRVTSAFWKHKRVSK